MWLSVKLDGATKGSQLFLKVWTFVLIYDYLFSVSQVKYIFQISSLCAALSMFSVSEVKYIFQIPCQEWLGQVGLKP